MPSMRKALAPLSRYIATPRVSKHRVFIWLDKAVLLDSACVAFATDSDTIFGILHSRFHELWSLRMGTSLEDRPRYTPTSCFETFPFPASMYPLPGPPPPGEGIISSSTQRGEVGRGASDIATAARRLVELRDNWLNPPNASEADLKKRTLTNLYNTRPAWLDNAHKTLDKAVAAAYGWDDYTPEMADNEILSRLLALNLERAQGTS